MTAVTRQAKRLLSCFGGPDNIHVSADLGGGTGILPGGQAALCPAPWTWSDLCAAHDLFWDVAPKHQQMEDHYFGSIKATPSLESCRATWTKPSGNSASRPKRATMKSLPASLKIAPIFESQNLAVDHNMLVMEVLRKTANKHDMVCLLHEKPFSGMNGSGKHNNWSLSAPGYGSLLNPGSSPQENAIFLTLLCATIKAVDEHADLLRASVAKSGNEHRLGAHEAPRPSFPSSWEICWMKSLSKSRKEALKKRAPKRPSTSAWTPCPCSLWTPPTGTAPAPLPSQAINFESRAVGLLPNLCMAHDGAQYHCGGKPG